MPKGRGKEIGVAGKTSGNRTNDYAKESGGRMEIGVVWVVLAVVLILPWIRTYEDGGK